MSDSTNTHVCWNCGFYSQRTKECRAAPPVRLPRQFTPDATAGNRVRDEALIWGWPRTKPDDWCGVFMLAKGQRR